MASDGSMRMAGMVKPYSGLPPGRHPCSIWQSGDCDCREDGRALPLLHVPSASLPPVLETSAPFVVEQSRAVTIVQEEETTALPVGTSNHRESMDFNERTFHGQTEPVQS